MKRSGAFEMGLREVEDQGVGTGFSVENVPEPLEVQAKARIVSTLGHVPAMNASCASVYGKFPASRNAGGFAGRGLADAGGAVEGEFAADTRIVAGDHAKQIGDGNLAPVCLN